MAKSNKKPILMVVWLVLLGGLLFGITHFNGASGTTEPGKPPPAPPVPTPALLAKRWPEILAHAAAPARGAETARRLSEIRPDLPPFEDTTARTVLEGTEFDELVIGRWIHLEQMDAGAWHIIIGGVVVTVRADRDGRPKRVAVYGPGDYDGPADGCEYDLTWTAGD